MNGRGRNELQRQLIVGEAQSQAPAAAKHGSRIERLSTRVLGMRRKAATALFIAVSLFLGVYAILGHDGIVAYQQKQRQAKQLHQQILSLQQENQRLALHDERLQNDPDTIEYEAREQMHYTRPGEVIYTLPQAPASAQHK
ncbi:MAG: FtsB family cell division protein [Acidobacteriaceae bacterium]